MPTYCKNFRCIADKCKDNCCIGWEIDIDPSTAELYDSVTGNFGKRLKSDIQKGEVCSFILKNERCPFLNENNLCDIIINLGEDKLCQICSDHPRYFEWFSHVKEGGIGLCCEEAARIVVTNKEKFDTYDIPCSDEGCDDYDERLYSMLTFARAEIITTLEKQELPLKERLAIILAYATEIQFMMDNYHFDCIPIDNHHSTETENADIKAFLGCFEELEPIDDSWQKYLQNLTDSADSLKEYHCNKNFDLYLKNIAIYFIWRYFLKGIYDEEILSKVFLSAISVAMIKLMYTNAEASGEKTDGETEYYVGDEGKLYNGTVDKLGLRAFFTITDETGNPTPIRARVVAGENVETGVEDIITTDAPIKVIENGQLIIIRGGVKYNVQGQRL